MTEKPEKINLSDINKRKVDNNLLNELRNLFKHSENQKERYNFTWNGKTKAYFQQLKPYLLNQKRVWILKIQIISLSLEII